VVQGGEPRAFVAGLRMKWSVNLGEKLPRSTVRGGRPSCTRRTGPRGSSNHRGTSVVLDQTEGSGAERGRRVAGLDDARRTDALVIGGHRRMPQG